MGGAAGRLLDRGDALVGAAAHGRSGRLDHRPPHSSGPTDTQLHPQHRFGVPAQHFSMLLHFPALVCSVLLLRLCGDTHQVTCPPTQDGTLRKRKQTLCTE